MTTTKQAPQKRKKETYPDKYTLSIWLDRDFREELNEIARRDDRSASYIARKAIEQYVASRRKEAA
jgi:predicted transcriptional regulator